MARRPGPQPKTSVVDFEAFRRSRLARQMVERRNKIMVDLAASAFKECEECGTYLWVAKFLDQEIDAGDLVQNSVAAELAVSTILAKDGLNRFVACVTCHKPKGDSGSNEEQTSGFELWATCDKDGADY